MTEPLLLAGVIVAAFVGFNIGGSSTGVAFGPAVGSGVISKLGAGLLMSVFVVAGGYTIGRRVVDTLGVGLIRGDPFTLRVSITVLFFIGFALFLSNIFGVPASTSMTAVGAIAGLGLARGALNVDVMMAIVSWWLVAPIVGFWVSAVVGRYLYDRLATAIAIDRSEGIPFELDRSGPIPVPRAAPQTTTRELYGALLVVGIACYNAFSAGASNVANAVAPLVGSGELSMTVGVLLGAGAMGLGALTIGRRTLETVGNDLTDLPLTAALVVSLVSSTLVTGLSALGIPAPFVVIATMSIVGLGWGRATRLERVSEAPTDRVEPTATIEATERLDPAGISGSPNSADPSGSPSPTDPNRSLSMTELYEPTTTAQVVLLQNLVPVVATAAAYGVFQYVPGL